MRGVFARRRRASTLVLLLIATGVVLVALVSTLVARPDGAHVSGEPGPGHVHALGVNPLDDALFVASHTGLYRVGRGETRQRPPPGHDGFHRRRARPLSRLGPSRLARQSSAPSRPDRVARRRKGLDAGFAAW